jgi:hypothetical protein
MSLLEEAYKKYTKVEIPVTEPADSGIKQPSEHIVQSVDVLAKELLRKRRSELQKQAADDWDEISADQVKLIAFASLEATRQIRESGAVPDTYTATTLCDCCQAEVPIFPGVPETVDACPWCLNGLAAPPVPGVKK